MVINGVLALALVGVGVGTYASMNSGKASNLTPGQVVTVTRGTLTSAVSASGNVDVATTLAVDLDGVSGIVTKIYVKAGDQVKKGQKLLQIDPSSAKDDLASNRADLTSAEAQLETATQGRTTAEQAQDSASVSSAQTAVDNAKTSLSAARDSYDLDVKQQRTLVHRAEEGVEDAKEAVYATDSARESAVDSAKNSLIQAQQSRDTTRLKDQQAIDSAEGQVSTAQKSLSSQRATVAVNREPKSASDIASAQTAVDKAEVSVRQAKKSVANTTLRAPIAGTVAAVNATKGQSSSGGGSSGSSSSGSSSSSGGSASAGGSSTTTASSSTSSTGLVTLVDTGHKEVTASVAEADIVKVKKGQEAEIVFSASDKTAAGRVTEIDATSTVTNNVVEFGVTVSLDSGAENIRIGQTASITITTGKREGVLSVPTSALTKVGDRYTVLRRTGSTESTVEVQTGLVGVTGTEITSGLDEGDTVVIPTTSSTGTSGQPG